MTAALIIATFLCSLTAGFLLAFAIVVMPGIRSLNDAGFLRAFQLIDRVIQNGQPVFILVWAGSALAVIVATGVGLWTLTGTDRLMLVLAALLYLGGVQLPTMAINLPLNNRLKRLDLASLTEKTTADERRAFEPRWNQWNGFRTWCACVTSLLLILLLVRL